MTGPMLHVQLLTILFTHSYLFINGFRLFSSDGSVRVSGLLNTGYHYLPFGLVLSLH